MVATSPATTETEMPAKSPEVPSANASDPDVDHALTTVTLSTDVASTAAWASAWKC